MKKTMVFFGLAMGMALTIFTVGAVSRSGGNEGNVWILYLILTFSGITAACGISFAAVAIWTSLFPHQPYRCANGHISYGIRLQYCTECGAPAWPDVERCSQGHQVPRGHNFCGRCGQARPDYGTEI